MSSILENAALAPYGESQVAQAAIAGLVVRPTTVAAITFWNAEPSGGDVLLIDRIFTHALVTTTAQSFFGMYYCMHTETVKVTSELTSLGGTHDGREPTQGVIIELARTVLDNGWFQCGTTGEAEEVGALPGSHAEWECNGRLVVKPKQGISLHVVAGVVGDTFTTGMAWYKVPAEWVPNYEKNPPNA